MDLTTGWDFTIAEHRHRAEIYVDQRKPLVLIGSPPCVAFSQLQTMIPDSERKACQLKEGLQHMEFMVWRAEGSFCTKTRLTRSRGRSRASEG